MVHVRGTEVVAQQFGFTLGCLYRGTLSGDSASGTITCGTTPAGTWSAQVKGLTPSPPPPAPPPAPPEEPTAEPPASPPPSPCPEAWSPQVKLVAAWTGHAQEACPSPRTEMIDRVVSLCIDKVSEDTQRDDASWGLRVAQCSLDVVAFVDTLEAILDAEIMDLAEGTGFTEACLREGSAAT